MKSKLSLGYYIIIILITVFLWFIFIGMNRDGNLPLFSKGWYLFLLLILFTNILFVISFLKIPKIQIIGNRISFKSLDFSGEFGQNDITKIERVASHINSWYSFRGGLEIYVKDKIYDFPLHIYTNETELLQKIYKVSSKVIPIVSRYELKNFSYLKYFYRSFGTFYFLLSIPFIYLLLNTKNSSPFFSKLILAILPLMCILAFLLSSKYVLLDGTKLKLMEPLFFKSTTIHLDGIAHLNAKNISTGKGGIKNITIELIDKRVLTWRAELNKQSELDEIINIFSRND